MANLKLRVVEHHEEGFLRDYAHIYIDDSTNAWCYIIPYSISFPIAGVCSCLPLDGNAGYTYVDKTIKGGAQQWLQK